MLIGAMLGLAVAKIGQREQRTKGIVIGGAILGLTLGIIVESIRLESIQRQSSQEANNQINSDSDKG